MRRLSKVFAAVELEDMSAVTRTKPPLLRSVAAVAGVGVLLVSVAGYAAAGRYDSKIQRVQVFSAIGGDSRPAAAENPGEGLQPMNVLVVGVDNREGLTRAQRAAWHLGRSDYGNQTDTIMIVHIGRDADHVTVASLPRDSVVTVPAHTDAEGVKHDAHLDKINSAYTIGGAPLLVRTVEKATDIHIDHYVGVSFTGFIGMVNAVDGVEVCLAEPIKDNPKYTSLDLPAGRSTIRDGMALSFVRARHVGTDFQRINRQQQFMASLLKKATSLGIVANPVRLDGFVSAAAESLQVDETLTREDILQLAQRMSSIRLDKIEFARLPIADDNYTIPGTDRGGFVKWEDGPAKKIFQSMINDTPIVVKRSSTPAPASSAATYPVQPKDIQVSVVNGSGIAGAGAAASADLQDYGFVLAAAPGTAEGSRPENTIVIYDKSLPGAEKAVKTLRQFFPSADFESDSSAGSLFKVTLGTNFTTVVEPGSLPADSSATDSSGSDISTPQKPVIASNTVCGG